MIRLSLRYTPENLQRAFALHYRKMFPIRGRILQLLGFMLLWVGVMLWAIYRHQHQRVMQYVYIFTGVVLIVFHTVFMRRLGHSMYKRLGKPDTSFDFEIDEQTISMIDQRGTYSFDWNNVETTVLSNEMLLLYTNAKKMQFYFLPKENFATTNDFETVKAWAATKAKKVIK